MTARYVACPVCRSEGKDSTGNHLKLFEDGKAGFCFRGHGRVVLDGESGDDEGGPRRVSYTSRPVERDTALEMAQIATYKCLAYPQRKITKETMEFFGVKTAVSPETGQPAEHYYPYYDEFDVLSGYKCRILPKNFGGKGVIGKAKNWFGWQKVSGRKFVILVEGECLTGDSEVLTPSGWVRLDEYDNQPVLVTDHLSNDGVGGRFEYPLAYIAKPYDGEIRTITSKQVSFSCTPNHGMVVRVHGGSEKPWVKVPFDEAGTSQKCVPKSTEVDGPGIDLTDDQLRLCIALSADAYFFPNGWKAKVCVKKDRKKERLRSILKECGVEWREWSSKTRPDFVEISFRVPQWATRRVFDWSWIELATLRQRRLILEELVEWDGNRVPNRAQVEYSSKYKENVDWVQTLAHTAGFSSSVIHRSNAHGEWYKASILLDKTTACYHPTRAVTEKSPDGHVYCVQVSTGSFLMRRDGKIMVIGNSDVLACHEMMKVLKPDRPPYNVLSVPSGAPEPDENGRVNLGKDLRLLLPKLLEFEKVVLCLDMDGPGRALANAIAEFLCSTTAVSIATLPVKDSAQMWEEGREQEWAKAINNARKYVTADIVTAADDPDEVDEPLVEGTRYSFLPRTCDKLHGFRTQEMTGWIAPENVGKSSMMRQMMYEDLARDPDAHVGAIFLEETAKKTKQAVVAYHCGVPLNKYRANPSCADPVLKQEAKELIFPRMHLFTHKTQTVSDDLILRKIEYFVKAMGCKRIYCDHLSYIVSAMDTRDERRTIDTFLTKLARSVEDWDYCLNIVSHIKRGEREQARMESKQKYPYWEILKMEDARGSGGISQLCHNMVAIEREVLDPNLDNTRGRVRTRVLRAREWGFTGLGDVLTFNEEGKYAPIIIEEFDSP